jgi:hypothetical protein
MGFSKMCKHVTLRIMHCHLERSRDVVDTGRSKVQNFWTLVSVLGNRSKKSLLEILTTARINKFRTHKHKIISLNSLHAPSEGTRRNQLRVRSFLAVSCNTGICSLLTEILNIFNELLNASQEWYELVRIRKVLGSNLSPLSAPWQCVVGFFGQLWNTGS